MSLLSSPYLPERISLSSKTGLITVSLELVEQRRDSERVNCDGAVALKDLSNRREYSISNNHILALPYRDVGEWVNHTLSRHSQSLVPFGVFN